ncbi:MAG: TetR/AcrR family transcriptional regulator [Alphaproteobacteria bacterium]|nr:TetR/AcrR family transcriptional regulator [Alphaproteobacteria bacterium]
MPPVKPPGRSVSPVRPQRRRGLSAAKNRAIVDAAARAFLDSGFHQASMDRIAARARVSKQTIYNHYRTKEDLFAAIIRDRAGGLVSDLAGRLGRSRAGTAAALRDFGESFLAFLLRPDTMALYRLLVAESARRDDLGANVYRMGPAQTVGMLAEFLAARAKAGELRVTDPNASAELLLGMIRGQHQIRALFGGGPRPSPARLRAWVAAAVAAFLAAHRR